jgi:hypothetical protein
MLQAPITIEHSEHLRREINTRATIQQKPRETAGDALLWLAKLGEELNITGPADLSSRIDDYLYGGQ